MKERDNEDQNDRCTLIIVSHSLGIAAQVLNKKKIAAQVLNKKKKVTVDYCGQTVDK